MFHQNRNKAELVKQADGTANKLHHLETQPLRNDRKRNAMKRSNSPSNEQQLFPSTASRFSIRTYSLGLETWLSTFKRAWLTSCPGAASGENKHLHQ